MIQPLGTQYCFQYNYFIKSREVGTTTLQAQVDAYVTALNLTAAASSKVKIQTDRGSNHTGNRQQARNHGKKSAKLGFWLDEQHYKDQPRLLAGKWDHKNKTDTSRTGSIPH